MKFTPSKISDIISIEPQVYRDQRGFFMETFQAELFRQQGLPEHFVQDNHTASKQGSLRGMHYQIHQAQGKLVRVVVGEVYDVAVDLRRYSPTFGRWVGSHLSADNKIQLWIPAGFAHGFYVLSEWAEVIYKVTDFYAPEWDRTILWNDPAIGITWPLMGDQPPLLSTKDTAGVPLEQAEVYEDQPA